MFIDDQGTPVPHSKVFSQQKHHAGPSREETPVPLEVATRLAETFKALGDPSRVRILDVLSRAERCVSDVSRLVGLSESAVSHQLRLLRSLRLVRTRRAGRLVFYALDDHHIVGLFAQALEHVQEQAPEGVRDTAADTGEAR